MFYIVLKISCKVTYFLQDDNIIFANFYLTIVRNRVGDIRIGTIFAFVKEKTKK